MAEATTTSIDDLSKSLHENQQDHLLQFWDDLNNQQRCRLQLQLASIDFDLIRQLSREEHDDHNWSEIASRAKPPKAIRLSDKNSASSKRAIESARQALKDGELGAILVAGGQGTRLGFPHPKGMFEIGPVSNRTLFQIHIDKIKALAKRYKTSIPLFLMTSPATDEETREFLQLHNNFGLPDEDLTIFCQGTMPAINASSGKLILTKKGKIFTSPDGHGGMLAAFRRNGCLSQVQQRGIKHLFYFQIDNPLVSICDLETVGHHIVRESEMTTQVVAKTDACEKVGNVVEVDGQTMVIEYSDLDKAAAERKNADGSLELWAGNVAVHVFAVDFLNRAAENSESLPFHRALKKVPFVDIDGNRVEPSEPNAIKFERFIFDLLPLAKNAIVVEVDAETSFSPLKNESGALKDTPETTRAAIVRESTRLLTEAGAAIADGVDVEVGPLFALDAKELKTKIQPNLEITQPIFYEN